MEGFILHRHGITEAGFVDLDFVDCVLVESQYQRGRVVLGPKRCPMRLSQSQCAWLGRLLIHNATTGALPFGDPTQPDYEI